MTASPAIETGCFTCGHERHALPITSNSERAAAPRGALSFATFLWACKEKLIHKLKVTNAPNLAKKFSRNT